MKKSQKKFDYVDTETGEITTEFPSQAKPEPPKPVIKTPYTAKYYPKDHEVNTDPSMTVPNQSMTVLEMVKRHRQGLPIDGNPKQPVYNGEELIPDLSTMDLADKQAYIDSVADHLVEVRARIEKAKEEAADKAKVKEFEKWHKEKLNEVINTAKAENSNTDE